MGVGVVAALAMELRALGPATGGDGGLTSRVDGSLLAVSGIGGAAAAHAARALIDRGATALASWGLAGGLDPALRAGTVCLPKQVIEADGSTFPTAPAWRAYLRELIVLQCPVSEGGLLTQSRIIDTVAGKAAAFRETGAVSVDMESGAIARVAADHGLPFVAVRVIVDTARDVLPRAIVQSSAGGPLRIWRLFAALALAPGDLAAVLRLSQRFRAASSSLAIIARAGSLWPPAASAVARYSRTS